MRIAIFENRISDIRGAIEGLQLFIFHDLEFDFFAKSQDFKVLAEILEYDLVLVDLDLATGSELDGYSLIDQILRLEDAPPIIIITGSYDVEEQLMKRNLGQIPFVLKPFDYKEIGNAISSVLSA